MKKFFSLIAAVLFAGSMMAQVTITPGDFPETTTADYSTVKEGVTVAVTASTVNAEQIRIFKNQTITISAEANITKIEFTCTANGSAKYGPGCFAAQEGYTFDPEGPTGTWEGSATSVSFTAESNQVRATQIVVTLDGEPVVVDTYTVAGAPASVFGEEWNPALEANDMKVANGLYKWEKTELQLTAGKIEFKVVKNHSWDNPAYPAQNYELNIAEEGEYILTITFDLATETVAAEAVKNEPLADPTNCAEAAAAALSVSKNNELYNDGKEYTIEGFVTEIATAYNEQYHNITFWMADTQDGGQVLEAYRAACETEADAPAVGDKVAVTGKLTKYNTTPEFAAGCTFAIIPEPVENPWTEILFEHAVSKADLAGDAEFEFDGLKVAITDSEDKMEIDANTARFGTADEFVQYDFRLKTGGKSQDGNKKNFITITVPADGELRLAVRSASGSDETRNLVLVQGGDTIHNAIVKDADAVEVAVDDSTTVKVFPYITVPVKAGEIAVGYPNGALNFYSFAFLAAPVVETTWTVAGSSATLFGTTWDPTNKANDMEEVEGIFVWEKEGLELAAGDIAFKVVKDHAWDEAYPSQDYKLAIDSAGIYTIKITFNPESKEVAAEATKTGEAVVLPTIILHGNFTGSWADTEAFVPAEDKLTASLALNLAEGTYEFGFKFDGTWKANGAQLTREANTTNLAEGSGNMKLTADQAGKYVIVYTYETQEVVVNFPAVLQTYDVAEAIAAGLTDGTEVEIRGIITKMEIKGKNFAKYGSINIYVKDATGAEGEFEFYNCYSIEADTFRTTAPEYDPASTEWIQLEEAADANGNTIHVGDTVIAFGSYKLFNETHELNTGCYLVDIRHADDPQPEVVNLDVDYVDAMHITSYSAWQLNFYKDYSSEAGVTYPDFYVILAEKSPTALAGLYEVENREIMYVQVFTSENDSAMAVSATNFEIEYLGEGLYQFTFAFLGDDNVTYVLNAALEPDAYEYGTWEDIELTDGSQDVEITNVAKKALKTLENGIVVIEKNGVRYNVLGQKVR